MYLYKQEMCTGDLVAIVGFVGFDCVSDGQCGSVMDNSHMLVVCSDAPPSFPEDDGIGIYSYNDGLCTDGQEVEYLWLKAGCFPGAFTAYCEGSTGYIYNCQSTQDNATCDHCPLETSFITNACGYDTVYNTYGYATCTYGDNQTNNIIKITCAFYVIGVALVVFFYAVWFTVKPQRQGGYVQMTNSS
ncbi:hypothetical protein Pelo_14519 [Pelomyxa schiedti]|nr:hypothetical protein Pelo_14519 [Pelomyxa schiedti]